MYSLPTIYVLSKNKKSISFFHLKIIIFTAMKNHSILHGHVIVIKLNSNQPAHLPRLADILKLSLVMRKPAFSICENKEPDQLHGSREADQHLCFRYTD